MLNWYVLYTKPRSERQVEEALATHGIETYFPVMPVPPRRGRSSVRPLFPCYLFARVDPDVVALSSINWTPGMRHVVAFGDIPARVDEGSILKIRQRLAQAQAIDEQGEMLESGDRVVITSGPFQDVEAVFDKKLSAAGRVRVLIDLLQRWTAVEMGADALRRVSTNAQPGRLPRRDPGGAAISTAS